MFEENKVTKTLEETEKAKEQLESRVTHLRTQNENLLDMIKLER